MEHQLPTPNHQHRRTASETPGSAARSRANRHCRGKLRPPSCRADPPPAQDQPVELLGVPICVGGSSRSLERRPRPQSSSTFFVRRPHSTTELPTAWGGFLKLGRSQIQLQISSNRLELGWVFFKFDVPKTHFCSAYFCRGPEVLRARSRLKHRVEIGRAHV